MCRAFGDIPVLRDCMGICAKCADEIDLSLETTEPVECGTCKRSVSWLWGEFLPDGKFFCINCRSDSRLESLAIKT